MESALMRLTKFVLVTTIFSGLLAIQPSFAAGVTSAETGTLSTIATIDKNEILVSIVAANKNVPSNIADLAKMMVDQHSANLTKIFDMAKSLNIPTLSGGDSEKLAADGKKLLMTIGGLEGDAFNKAYVDAMVKGHAAALELIDKHLMKTAKTEEMKKFMTDTRAVVEQHLEHAKKVQDEMKS